MFFPQRIKTQKCIILFILISHSGKLKSGVFYKTTNYHDYLHFHRHQPNSKKQIFHTTLQNGLSYHRINDVADQKTVERIKRLPH